MYAAACCRVVIDRSGRSVDRGRSSFTRWLDKVDRPTRGRPTNRSIDWSIDRLERPANSWISVAGSTTWSIVEAIGGESADPPPPPIDCRSRGLDRVGAIAGDSVDYQVFVSMAGERIDRSIARKASFASHRPEMGDVGESRICPPRACRLCGLDFALLAGSLWLQVQ